MKTRTYSRAFVLVYVIALIAIIGVAMGSLTTGLRITLSQTNRFHLAAVEQNLLLSALAWSQQSLGDPNSPLVRQVLNAGQSITLDAQSLYARPCAIHIQRNMSDSDRPGLRISTTCSYGRQTFKKSRDYTISPENRLSELPLH